MEGRCIIATLSGVEASVKMNDVLVAAMASWEFSDTTDPLEAPIFGNTFTTIHSLGIRKCSGSIKGYLNIEDTAGQEVLKAAYEGRTLITDFQLFIDNETLATYYTTDSTVTGSGVYLTTMNISAAQNEIIPVDIGFVATGSWVRVTEV